MASKHKIKRVERVLGWTKASHKGAVRYFTKEKPEVHKSLKRKKVCKFTKAHHAFKVTKEYPAIYLNSKIFVIYECEFCGKKDWKML